MASPVRYMSLRRLGVAAAGTWLIEPKFLTLAAMSVESTDRAAKTWGWFSFLSRNASPTVFFASVTDGRAWPPSWAAKTWAAAWVALTKAGVALSGMVRFSA